MQINLILTKQLNGKNKALLTSLKRGGIFIHIAEEDIKSQN